MNIILNNTFNESVSFGRVISKDTKMLFVNGFTKTVTNAQKIAIEDFIISLKSSGLWNKIDHLFLPCLAGSETEITLDVKSSYGNTTNIFYECNEGFFALTSDGAQTTNNAVSTSLWGNSFNFNVVPTDFHAVMKIDNKSRIPGRVRIGNIKQAIYDPIGDIVLSNTNQLYPGGKEISVKTVDFTKPIISTSKKSLGDTSTTYTEYNGQLSTTSIVNSGIYNEFVVGQEYLLYPFFGDPWGDTGQKCSVAGITGIKLYGCGTYLTSDEASDYSAIIETFLSSFS